ncbi:MAG: DUF87 domain-containing protein [Ruminococcus sp.]|nr:DUF87 domain-containing protein [Ruminococcus sp.]
MRLIPGKTKVKIELFRGVTLGDVVIGVITLALAGLVVLSTIPARFYVALGVITVGGMLLVRIDAQPNYMTILGLLKYLAYPKRFWRMFSDKHLLSKKREAKKGDQWNEFFSDKFEAEDELTLRESIEKAMAQKKQKKEQEEILNSKDSTDEEKNAVWQQRREKEKEKLKKKAENKDAYHNEKDVEDIVAFTGISDGFIEYDGKYYGTIIEIDPVEFRFFSIYRRNASIENCLGKTLRSLRPGYAANIIKIDRPIRYESYLEKEYDKLEALKNSYEKGFLTEDELKARVEIQYERINEMRNICYEDKVIQPFYYLALFNIDKRQLLIDTDSAITSLTQGELVVRRISEDKELAIFLKYTNTLDFEESEINDLDPEDYIKWAMPESVTFTTKKADINGIYTHHMRVVGYPSDVGDAWLAGVMSVPGTKVVVKITPMERIKSIKAIDRSLQELRGQLMSTGVDSKILELQNHIETLSSLLVTLQQDNESLLTVNIYITMYDVVKTSEWGNPERVKNSSLPIIADMKKTVRRVWQETGMRLNALDFSQLEGFIGSQVSGYDPYFKDGRGMPANTVAGMYPWIYARVSDVGGIRLGTQDGVPVIIDFFRRDSERVNSNMVIIGKSGSGKSYGTKSLLTNMASEDAKIFILDPENEYTELAHTLHGKIINVGNATQGRLNPFNIITTLEDDESEDTLGTGYAAHLQFLEEFFKQILPDVDKEALEYLNSLVERLYTNFGITMETDLSKLSPTDYPIFDDLYDIVLEDFQRTSNEYLRSMLQTLMNYVSKFATGGRNSNIWNGPSTITTDENFSVFNFQSLLSNRNTTIANAQMLLVLKYIDNEIIKNREYNRKYGLNRRIVVVIDEAHVFIDTKFPVALDFMFQLAKRIRKYNGMQIVITQNIKDFVGSEEIARKSTAIINACQYSFIFGLAPNDMDDLCKLYEKAGGINEVEQDQILTAPRGNAFTVMSPTSRSSFKIEVPQSMVDMFEQPDYQSLYFWGEQGEREWERFVSDSRELHDAYLADRLAARPGADSSFYDDDEFGGSMAFTFSEISAEEADALGGHQDTNNSGGVNFEEVTMHPNDENQGITDRSTAQTNVNVSPVVQPYIMQPVLQPDGTTVMQPVIPQIVQPAPAAPVDMNAIISAIRDEVKREMAQQLGNVSAAAQYTQQPEEQPAPVYEPEPAPQPEPVPEPEPEYEEPEPEYEEPESEPEYDEPDISDEEPDDDDYLPDMPLSDPDETGFDDEDDEDEDDDEGFKPKFDIMALLDEQLDSYGEMTLEERMEEIDVDTMEVSLDELMSYVKESRKRR